MRDLKIIKYVIDSYLSFDEEGHRRYWHEGVGSSASALPPPPFVLWSLTPGKKLS
jgi:hypothetical protein